MILDEDVEPRKATVFVREDQLSLAIGRKGQNVRLASKLSTWDIDIVPSEETGSRISAESVLGLEPKVGVTSVGAEEGPTLGLSEELYGTLRSAGYGSRAAILGAGVDALAKLKGMDEDKARLVVRTLVNLALDGAHAAEEPVDTGQAPDENVSEHDVEGAPVEATERTDQEPVDGEGGDVQSETEKSSEASDPEDEAGEAEDDQEDAEEQVEEQAEEETRAAEEAEAKEEWKSE